MYVLEEQKTLLHGKQASILDAMVAFHKGHAILGGALVGILVGLEAPGAACCFIGRIPDPKNMGFWF